MPNREARFTKPALQRDTAGGQEQRAKRIRLSAEKAAREVWHGCFAEGRSIHIPEAYRERYRSVRISQKRTEWTHRSFKADRAYREWGKD